MGPGSVRPRHGRGGQVQLIRPQRGARPDPDPVQRQDRHPHREHHALQGEYWPLIGQYIAIPEFSNFTVKFIMRQIGKSCNFAIKLQSSTTSQFTKLRNIHTCRIQTWQPWQQKQSKINAEKLP